MAKWEFDSAGFSRSREFIFESCFPCSFLHLSCPCSRISDGSVGTFLLGILFGITVKVVPLHAVIVYIFLLSEFSQVHMACRGLTWTPYELRNILKTGKIVGKNFLGKGQPSWGGIWMSSGTSWKYSLENTLGGKKKKQQQCRFQQLRARGAVRLIHMKKTRANRGTVLVRASFHHGPILSKP